MSDPQQQPARPDRPRPDDQSIGPLVRLAGPREAVPADRMRRVKAAVHAEWRHETRRRSRRTVLRWSIGALAAAALVLVALRVRPDDAPGAAPVLGVLATVDEVSGPALRVHGQAGASPAAASIRIGDRLEAGDSVDTTAGGRAALRLAGGASVRLDHGTRLRLAGDRTLILDEGAVYVEAGSASGAPALEVRTALGVIRDIGTRFEVRLRGSALRVRVRDGLVRLVRPRETHDARAGDELTLEGSGRLVRRAVPVDGPDWTWVRALEPFDIDGRSLREFLEWLAGEHGWQVRFADAAVEEKARTTTLHGSVAGLTSDEALAAVLPPSGVEHRLDGDVLWIAAGSGGTKD